MTILQLIPVCKENYTEDTCFDNESYEDYAVWFIYDFSNDKIIFCEDNIHSTPESFFNGYCSALRNNNIDFKIFKGIILIDNNEDPWDSKMLKKNILTNFDKCVILDIEKEKERISK